MRSGPVELAAKRDLRLLSAEARQSALAQSVLQLARTLDRGLLELKDEPAFVREIRIAMQALREMSPARAGDDVDELRARRAARASG